MPYLNFKVRNVSAIICGVPHRSKCQYCGKPSEFLCDFPVGKNKQGKKKTCDRKLCRNCSQKGISQNVDFCRYIIRSPKLLTSGGKNKLLVYFFSNQIQFIHFPTGFDDCLQISFIIMISRLQKFMSQYPLRGLFRNSGKICF